MQAITTKYYGPTNTKGSKFVAECEAGRIAIPYDYDLDSEENHIAAANALLAKLGWDDRWNIVSGGMKDGRWSHVLVSK
jgi:hypothetical protein